MLASAGLLPAAVLLLLEAATAAPQPTRIARQETAAAATAPWVTIGPSGTTTITPVQTTINGTPTLISGAPDDLTATVFTQTNNAIVSTSTGNPPLPTATDSQGGGSFPVCQNTNGPGAPFCLPATGDTLNPGNTYYITWDPTFFPASNTTVNVLATYVNTTIMAWSTGLWQAGWGFAAFPVDASMLQGGSSSNITITMKVLAAQGSASSTLQGPTIIVANPPTFHPPAAVAPTGPALYIGLPTIGGFVALVVIGTCIWNRKNRRIGLGNIMSRSRHGYAAGKSRTERVAGRRRGTGSKGGAIRLMDRRVGAPAVPEAQRYRDAPAASPPAAHQDSEGGGFGAWDAGWHEQVPGRRNDLGPDLDVGLPRRDSDALGSLAGTPTEERQMDFRRGGAGGGNAFRDEITRQERERY